MNGSADAPIARVQPCPCQPSKVNRPHARHRPSSVRDTSNYMMRIRRRPDNDRRVPNDKRRPSKLAPPMRVLFTSERTNERQERPSDRRIR
ncbi:hypothetical protein FOTG_14009 [Fusarium oxysporum f. sp. vasinfectum 25433]|uniref:Uncharacterized protein n=1 Tax=Fusarium oxysporum f. sp. vasinfectum 25433 TaxID=1089449 RepID=X0MBB1_FUSOX|nr:hypothetical protein FOTG_14009 [Fusarium oxysporum f. sp. vasinfectum 25433]